MEEIVHAFGIDWRLIVIQMFNFAILVGVLWYFLYTPVLKILREREEKIRKGVEDAEAANTARLCAEKDRAVVLQTAEQEAKGVVKNAEKLAEEKTLRIHKEADKKALAIIKDAEAQALELAEKSRRESEADIARIAILAAEKILVSQHSK
jgi:F-type H+-transporting ATPase subunit b